MSRLRDWITQPYRRYPMLTGMLLPLVVVAAVVMESVLMKPEAPAVDPLGRSALTLAAERGESERVMAMLDDGTAVDAGDACGWTALMKAAAQGHLEMLEALLARGADPEHRDQAGYTPLMVAVVNGEEATSRALLEAGARVDSIDDEAGWSSLTWAAKDGRLQLVTLLLAYGADPGHVAGDGTTPLEWAKENEHQEVALHLEAAMQETG
ncbi:MAG: ankyrin repeat domain-containing protein [Halomonas sp.]|uniref:ankyrin repeat domain-containing protein n=1 Tax=Halomonas sp. TaxID=1486246 RepID=UPI0039704788